ncbi:MAG: UbiX family flavin prenyltransferase [Xanthomonadales bacterium]|nr:UbiX family flavin prenyltransferase [Xanthomonadales bacterium]
MLRIIVGISGASGAIYGVRLLQVLRGIKQVETHLIVSRAAALTIAYETDFSLPEVKALADVVHSDSNLGASIASGSYRSDGMIIAPCSMKTLSAVAHSSADNLLVRAADVVLKERRLLVLMPRETPLHTGHCKLLYQASKLGAVIAPAMPAFYNKPETVDDIIDQSVGRILDLFGLDTGTVKRWEGSPP